MSRVAHDGWKMLGFTLAAAITALLLAPPAPAEADQVASLRAQATQIAQDLVLEQLQIGNYEQQYDVDGAKVQHDVAEIDSTENQIEADARRVSHDRAVLQSEAITAYINLDPELGGTQVLFEDDQSEAVVRAEYEEVTSGDMSLTIDAIRSDENGLRAERATLAQQEAQDQATTNQEAGLAGDARQTEAELQSKQSEITGELAVAVAQQQAAQAVAAAKAVRAAQAAAAAAAAPTSASSGRRTSTSSTLAAPSDPPTATPGIPVAASSGDPSLPPFLQCVLQAESSGNYGAVSPGGTYMGGFQFSQATWNEAAVLAGMPQLANMPPNEASPAEQDDLAIALYQADGEQPWNDSCRNS